MNPVEEGGNQFADLFKAMPAGRIGKMEDIAGAVIYLSSQAGVSLNIMNSTDDLGNADTGDTGICRWPMPLRRWGQSSVGKWAVIHDAITRSIDI